MRKWRVWVTQRNAYNSSIDTLWFTFYDRLAAERWLLMCRQDNRVTSSGMF